MDLKVFTQNGKPADIKVLSVSDKIFAIDYNEALVHQIVTAYLAGGRAGTKAQKSRSDVKGSGKKPWRQKGTGRARAGTKKSPIWRSGGVTFAAKPRDFSQKINKKMYRLAIRTIFSELLRQERLLVLDAITIESPKTKAIKAILNDLALSGKLLLLIDSMYGNLLLSSRNLFNVSVSEVNCITPVDLVNADKVVVTVAAIKQLEERLK